MSVGVEAGMDVTVSLVEGAVLVVVTVTVTITVAVVDVGMEGGAEPPAGSTVR